MVALERSLPSSVSPSALTAQEPLVDTKPRHKARDRNTVVTEPDLTPWTVVTPLPHSQMSHLEDTGPPTIPWDRPCPPTYHYGWCIGFFTGSHQELCHIVFGAWHRRKHLDPGWAPEDRGVDTADCVRDWSCIVMTSLLRWLSLPYPSVPCPQQNPTHVSV